MYVRRRVRSEPSPLFKLHNAVIKIVTGNQKLHPLPRDAEQVQRRHGQRQAVPHGECRGEKRRLAGMTKVIPRDECQKVEHVIVPLPIRDVRDAEGDVVHVVGRS